MVDSKGNHSPRRVILWDTDGGRTGLGDRLHGILSVMSLARKFGAQLLVSLVPQRGLYSLDVYKGSVPQVATRRFIP